MEPSLCNLSTDVFMRISLLSSEIFSNFSACCLLIYFTCGEKCHVIMHIFYVNMYHDFCLQRSGVNINNFLNVLVSDPGPQCLMWLPILHRMVQVENGNLKLLVLVISHRFQRNPGLIDW